jgi:hypothetical protein
MMKCDRAKPVQARQVWTKPIRQLALGGALGLIALACIAPGTARAEDNGDTTIFGNMLKSLGIGGENNIEYRERPPLVVPPTRELPPPQTSRTVRDPNWPVDPKSADLRKKGDQVRDLNRLPVPQRPAEPGVAGAGGPSPSAETTAAIPSSQPAAERGFFGRLFMSSEPPPGATITVPTRKSLTEPPVDYESPAPSQTYGAPAPAAAAKSTTPESALQTQPGQTQPGAPRL